MIREALAEGSWTLGEYAVSIRSDLRSTASLPASPTAYSDDICDIKLGWVGVLSICIY